MAVNYAISQKAPALPIDVGKDFMFALGKCSAAHGGKAMSQQGLKFLQAIAIGHSALAVKEADKMSVQQRDRAAAKCMQEIAVPGLIKTIELALDSAAEPLPMPFRWQDHLYVTTLGLGVYLVSVHRFRISTRRLILLYCCLFDGVHDHHVVKRKSQRLFFFNFRVRLRPCVCTVGYRYVLLLLNVL